MSSVMRLPQPHLLTVNAAEPSRMRWQQLLLHQLLISSAIPAAPTSSQGERAAAPPGKVNAAARSPAAAGQAVMVVLIANRALAGR